MTAWKPFAYENAATHERTVYDLAHLHPLRMIFEQAAKQDKPARTYTVNVIFGLHCFTRGLTKNETPDAALLYADARERRLFDFQRYELSKSLPDIVRSLPNRKCYHTGKSNFFSIEQIDNQGNIVEYEIYFQATRSSVKGILDLFVQSAYVRDDNYASSRPHKKSIAFFVILFKKIIPLTQG